MAPIATSPILASSHLPSYAAPVKSIPLLRKAVSGTVRTRDEAGLDLDDNTMSISGRPIKMARTVTFNPTVQEQTYTTSPNAIHLERELDTVRVETRRAIEDHILKSSERYDDLKMIFGKHARKSRDTRDGERSENEDMRLHLLALTSCVSLLGKDCNGLVRAVLECEWMGRDEAFVKAYVHFLGNLASAQGSYVGTVLKMLVDKFSGLKLSSGRLYECPVVNRDQLSARLHMALKYLLRLIPSASGVLSPMLSVNFPLAEDSKRANMTYVGNLIKLMEYAPELKSEILALMTDRVVKIDMQMQVDFDELDEEEAAAIMQAVPFGDIGAAEEDEDEDDSDLDSVTSDDADDDLANIKLLQGKVEKLDAMLDTLFTIYEPFFADPNSLIAHTTFQTLLSHFRNIIIPTYRSRHTQFLLFHFAQKSDHLVDTFAGECVDLAFNSGRHAVLKQSAAAYLASFVARGVNVLPHTVREVFEFIGANLDKIRLENESGCRGPDLNRYSTFYATTQALIYIFCFRWRDLIISHEGDDIEDEEDYHTRDLEWYPGVKETLARTIYSKLNPLKICAPEIVTEFARIAHYLRFLYVYPLMETNKRVRLSHQVLSIPALRESGAGTASAEDQESWNQLDSFFPFDPYQLPVSRRWIEDDYVQWKAIPGMERLDDEEEESTEGEDNDEDELEDDEEDTATEADEDGE